MTDPRQMAACVIRVREAVRADDTDAIEGVLDMAFAAGYEQATTAIRRHRLAGGNPEFLGLLEEMAEVHRRKALDYGRGADPLANLRAGAEFGIPAWVGVAVRMQDKMHRIKSFCLNGKLANESLEDSLIDLAAYSLLAIVLLREEKASGAAEAVREVPGAEAGHG